MINSFRERCCHTPREGGQGGEEVGREGGKAGREGERWETSKDQVRAREWKVYSGREEKGEVWRWRGEGVLGEEC